MKKWISVLLCALCLLVLSGTAMATSRTFEEVPASQMSLILPEGLSGSQTCTDGLLSLAINDDATDWVKALAATGGNGSVVEGRWQIRVPEGIEDPKYLFVLYPISDEADAQDTFDTAEGRNEAKPIFSVESGVPFGPVSGPNSSPFTDKGLQIARPIVEAGIMVPSENDFWIYLGWYDEARQPLKYQKVHVSLTHSKTEAFETEMPAPVPADRIVPADNATVLDVQDGQITYTGLTAGTDYITGVKAPQGAKYYRLLGGLGNNSGENLPIPASGVIDQLITFGNNGPDTASSSFGYLFFDENQQLLDMETLSIARQPSEELLPWLAYVPDTNILGADQLVVENGSAESGYQITYDESTGHLKCSFGQPDQKKGMGKPGPVKLSIIAPQWALGYRMLTVGNNSLLGPNGGSKTGLNYELDKGYPNGFEPVIPGEKITLSYDPFTTVVPEDDRLTIYVPDASANVPYFADLCVIQWLDEDGPALNPTYFWRTTENFVIKQFESKAIQKKDLGNAPVTEPTVVVPNGKPFEGASLLFISYYTEGTNAWHYDLSMVDKDGEELKPGNHGSNVWIYLPFPEGHQSGQKYKLHHYLDGLYNKSDLGAMEEIPVEETANGLLFETSSFSPFVLSRTGEAAPETTPEVTPTVAPAATDAPTQPPVQKLPPKAGDATPIGMLAALMLLAAAGMLVIRRRAVR